MSETYTAYTSDDQSVELLRRIVFESFDVCFASLEDLRMQEIATKVDFPLW